MFHPDSLWGMRSVLRPVEPPTLPQLQKRWNKQNRTGTGAWRHPASFRHLSSTSPLSFRDDRWGPCPLLSVRPLLARAPPPAPAARPRELTVHTVYVEELRCQSAEPFLPASLLHKGVSLIPFEPFSLWKFTARKDAVCWLILSSVWGTCLLLNAYRTQMSNID